MRNLLLFSPAETNKRFHHLTPIQSNVSHDEFVLIYAVELSTAGAVMADWQRRSEYLLYAGLQANALYQT